MTLHFVHFFAGVGRAAGAAPQPARRARLLPRLPQLPAGGCCGCVGAPSVGSLESQSCGRAPWKWLHIPRTAVLLLLPTDESGTAPPTCPPPPHPDAHPLVSPPPLTSCPPPDAPPPPLTSRAARWTCWRTSTPASPGCCSTRAPLAATPPAGSIWWASRRGGSWGRWRSSRRCGGVVGGVGRKGRGDADARGG